MDRKKIFRAALVLGVALILAGCAQTSTGASSSPDASSVISSGTSPEIGGGMNQRAEGFGELTGAYFSESGDSAGNLYYIETDVDEDGTPIVRAAQSPQHDIRAEIGEYRMPEGLLDRIAAIADEAGMTTWGDLPMGDLIPLDAATPTITLTFASADPDDSFPIKISFTAWDEFPEGGIEAFYAIRDELSACITPDNQIRTYQEPETN